MRTLNIALVTTGKVNESDFKVQALLKEKFASLRERGFPYSDIDFINFSFNDEPNLISKGAIASLNPAKYLLCKEALKDKIIPVLAVRKSRQLTPYYPAFFIANKFSSIHSIRSNEIRKVYAVDDESTSGFIAPIYKLWEAGIIQYPSIRGIEEKGWDFEFVGKHTVVENRVIGDEYAIGMTGQFSSQDNPKLSKVKPILRYYYLPQDVLTISSDLEPFKEDIRDMLVNIFAKDSSGKYLEEAAICFEESSKRICGFSDFNYEFKNSLEELKGMMKHVETYSSAKYFTDASKVNTTKFQDSGMKANELRTMIGQEQEMEVIEKLKQFFLDGSEKTLLNEMILIESSYRGLLSRKRVHVISDEEYMLSLNKIRLSILEFINLHFE